MKASGVIKQLVDLIDENGDQEVMFIDRDNNPCSITRLRHQEVAECDGYPEEWNMPDGFKFFRIEG